MKTNDPAPEPAGLGGGAPGDPDMPGSRQLRTILVAVCVALMAVIASVSGLNVAQPDLAVDFGASQTTVLWFINVYTLTLAALLLPLGAVGDRVGRKPMLVVGLVVFGVASAAAGLAPSSEIMLAARMLSGVGAAVIMPITLAVITSTFPDDKRGQAIGIWTGVAGGGGILGMFLSAVLVDVASWRWLFALPVALIVVALVMTLRSVPNSRERHDAGFDTIGALTSVVAVSSFIIVLQEGPERGWSDAVTVAGLVVGLVSTSAFVVWELRRGAAALLDVRLFGTRGLSAGSVVLLVVFGVQAGVFVVLFLFLQSVVGWSALLSTLAMMPMAVLMMVASALAPRLSSRFGARVSMGAGILLFAAGLAAMAGTVSVDGGYPSILPGMLAMGVGMGLAMTPSTESITSSLPRERQGVASALNDVTRELGTALGVALLGGLLTAGYRDAVEDTMESVPPRLADAALQGIAPAVEAAGDAGEQHVLELAQQAFVQGWQSAMWAGVAVMGALFLYVVLRGPRHGTGPGPDTTDDAVVRPSQPATRSALGAESAASGG